VYVKSKGPTPELAAALRRRLLGGRDAGGLTCGDGYTHVTRQVAAHDAAERGPGSFGGYYSEGSRRAHAEQIEQTARTAGMEPQQVD
jgi:hypothetical protein